VPEELKRELAEARDQQVATSEILRIISSSPGDLQPVLDTIVATATRLCGAEKATIRRRSGDAYLMVAEYGCSPEQRAYMEKNPVAAGPGTVVGRAGETRKPVYVADVEADPGFRQMDLATGAGFRAALAVPLLRGGEIIGVLMLLHSKPYPFTAHHIERAQTFADQAVIAIENARLFEAEQVRTREVEEALETQTATAAILRVIASSPSDLAPVLSAVAERASRLCGAFDALVLLRKGDELQTLAHYGPIPAHAGGPIARDWVIGRAFVDRTPVQVEDLTAAGADFPRGYAMAIRDGFRTSLAIPMQRKAEPVGVICVRRTEPRPFTEKQIALLLTFADQAVIAIENARLFEAEQASKRELQESLEYQTATSEVLSVISRSPTNVQAVFETIARSAARLCSALNCFVYRFDGKLVHFAAADRLSEGEARVRSMYPLPPGRASAATRAILNGAVEEIPDVELDTDYQHLAGAQAEGYHSIVAVPILKDGRTVGAIAVSRSHVGRFPPRQIELLQTFAGQAVIAIENTRLFEEVQARTHELTESLEYQTATSDVLGVISQSPTQLQPVVDAIVQTAKRLCEAERAHIWRLRDGRFDLLAHTLNDTELTAYLEQNPIPTGPNSFAGRAVLEKRVVHVPDVSAHPEIGTQGQLQRTHVRTMLVVPLLREGEPIGVLSLT
jgi:GAF domain-containing protein